MSIENFYRRQARKSGFRQNIVRHFSENSGRPTVMDVEFPNGNNFTIATGGMINTLSGGQKRKTKGFLRDLLYTNKSQKVN